MMCAIMNKLRRISAAARHRPVFDLRIPALLYPGSLTPAEIRRGIGPCFFSSRLTQPLFTKLTNLLQNRAHASEERPALENSAGALECADASALLKAATCRRTPNQKSSGTLTRSILKLFTVFTKVGGAFSANQEAEHHL
jgi:hypothetical protein